MATLAIINGQVLLASGELADTSVVAEDGRIVSLSTARTTSGLDARGLLVLPGIVDLHGDAFERQLQPRPGVEFETALALRDTEAQLLANGITTALHAITLSWEPGLRSRAAWRAMLDAIESHRPTMACDMRVHMRWELHNLDALEMALADIEAGLVHLLSFNDHTPAILRHLEDPSRLAAYTGRGQTDAAAFREMAERAYANESHVPAATLRLAEAARHHGLPIASHDDDSVALRDRYRALGARICEFPMAEEVAVAAREAGDAVVMGCPNVVRGKSHLGWASAANMTERDICTVLCSDYYYPAMLPAAFALAKRGRMSFGRAWSLISLSPARAAGLHDRGEIGPGMRADLVLVDPAAPRVVATIVAGRLAWMAPGFDPVPNAVFEPIPA
jgi:alpha-D-ribose 1-methylphosphonate 5-triphosphate diphosphatase